MIKIEKIYEKPWILDFLEKRNLVQQYIKSARNILNWIYWKQDFKLRKPKKNWIWSFRINQKYRAFGIIDENNNLLIFEINDHQNY